MNNRADILDYAFGMFVAFIVVAGLLSGCLEKQTYYGDPDYPAFRGRD